ncbi:MAG TPA: selenocysteine-specific translation elongation factor [Candidatus Limnocylindrales bacterium]
MADERPAPSVVIGTAGHIDHGKTTLLHALTGIDADRLPEERRRGMTIDVGYAHLTLDDGSTVDFVDVPGHDRLVGNMLVGAGEIDAALLVVAADDGPNAQTLEHLGLLDALGIRDGLVVVTKADLADEARVAVVAAEVGALLAATTLAGAPVVGASATTGDGIETVRNATATIARRVQGLLGDGRAPRLAIDRSFTVRGRGTVVTGSLRGGPIRAGMTMRLVPGDDQVRVREVQVRGETVDEAAGGRTALLIGFDGEPPRRGQVLSTDRDVVATSRLLVALRGPTAAAAPADRERLRVHLGTEQAGVLVVRGPREAIDLPDGTSIAILRLDATIAAAPGDRFALRRPSPGSVAGGGIVLDATPPRGVSRRRLTPDRAAALAAGPVGSLDARVELHGAILVDGTWRLAPDVEAALGDRAVALVTAHHEAQPDSAGLPAASLRADLGPASRRHATLTRDAAVTVAGAVVDRLVADGTLARDEDRIRTPDRAAGLSPATREAMDRLEAGLAVATPPPLAEAARAADCPPDGVRALEATGRIVRLEDDLAWAAPTYRDLVRRALSMAAAGPLTPAAYRDATRSSRRYVMVILEDMDRRGLLQRTDAGHVLGPTTLARMRERASTAARGQ